MFTPAGPHSKPRGGVSDLPTLSSPLLPLLKETISLLRRHQWLSQLEFPFGYWVWVGRYCAFVCVCVHVHNQCCDEHCSKHTPRPKWMGGAVDSFPPHITQCSQFCCLLKWREKEGKVLALSGYEPLDQWPGRTMGSLTSRPLHWPSNTTKLIPWADSLTINAEAQS